MAIRYPGRQAPVGNHPLPGGYTTDLTPPTVVTFTPGDGVGGVLVGSNIVLTFNESIQRGAGVIAIHSGSADGPLVESFDASSSLNLLFSGNSLTIDPAGNLLSGMHYYVTFGAGTVKDMAGNSYAGTTTYDFTTAPFDDLAPTVTGFTPADGMTGVPIESNIVLTFSELIQRGAGTIAIHSGSFDGTVVESFNVASSPNLTFSGTTLTINPALSLQNNTHYFVTFDSGTVRDLAGNGYIGSTVYDFTTVAAISSWDNGSGRGLLNIDMMLENATGRTITDASLFGDGGGLQDWALNQIQAPDAWSAGYTGNGVVVAVIDTGVNYLHSDLGSNIWKNSGEIAGNGLDDDGNGYVDDGYGWDFVNRDGDAFDDNGHGSSVAGIIAGLNNGFGVTGVAFDAQVMPVKVLNSGGGGSDISVADGIYYAVNNGADVINLSLGGGYSARIASALQYAVNSGVLVCMASGNAAQSQPVYPALLAQTTGGIAVGAVNSSGSLASFSNGVGTAASYDFLVAPGVDIYSTSLGNSYEKMTGTSMATPFVSGAAALLLSAREDYFTDWTLEQLENVMTMSASPFLSGATFIASPLSGRRVVQSVESIDDHFMSACHIIEQESELVTLVGIAV